MKPKLDILYLASHGFAVRMLVQTNLLGILVKKGLRIGVVSSDKEDSTLKDYCSNNGVFLYEFTPRINIYSGIYEVFRRYAFEDIRNNPALWEKHLRNVHSSKTNNRKVLYNIFFAFYKLCNYFPFFRKVVLYYENKLLESSDSGKFITDIDPRIIVSTYPIHVMESALIKAAKKSVERKSIIHLLSWDNITAKGKISQLADYYIAWGNIMKDELINHYGVEQNKVNITGVPHFDLHHQCTEKSLIRKYLIDVGLNPEIPYLFFGMSSPYFAPHEIDIVEEISSWVTQKKFGEMQFVIRPHPQNMEGSMSDFSWLTRLKALESDIVYVDYPRLNKSKINWSMKLDDMRHLSLLIGGALIVLNSGSTISIDALIHDKPVIITGFDGVQILPWHLSARRILEYEHIKKLLNLKAIIKVDNYSNMENAIYKFIKNPNFMKSERAIAIFEECYIQDGKATERVILLLEALNQGLETC